jgi:hypothetical protein
VQGHLFNTTENTFYFRKKLIVILELEVCETSFDIPEEIKVREREIRGVWMMWRRFHSILVKILRRQLGGMRARIVRMHQQLSLVARCFN